MIHSEKVEYFMINETVVSEDTNIKHSKIIRENVSKIGDHSIFTLTFRQVLSECDVPNWNGRSYSVPIMWDSWSKNPLIQHDLAHSGGVQGEYGHPLVEKGQNELVRQLTIFPPNVCWIIRDPHMEGKLLMGECTTVAGGYGDMLRDRALSGIVPMASTRAIGGCDSRGNVLPGLQMITADSVTRQSCKTAYADPSTYKVNTYGLPAGNSMSESAVPIDLKSESFKDFLLTEAVSRDKIAMVCDTLKVDYDSMELTENALKIVQINGNTKNTIVMPISKLVGASHHVLFGK